MDMQDTWLGYYRRRRSKAGKELDEMYERHEIGWAYYHKVYNKPKYWEYY